ncbi:MAG: tetratricopeptide repeat protein [Bacteroidales bacterium]
MKDKLRTFSDFSQSLFPHEIDYLLSIQQFQKEENLKILQIIHHNAHHPGQSRPLDPPIDKRTYSYMKNWIQENLRKNDVDVFYDWLTGIERSIMNDDIETGAEKDLLHVMDNMQPTAYYFMKFFRVIQHYRDYLIVRNRVVNYQRVSAFLARYSDHYLRSQTINNKMNEAAEKVIFKKVRIPEEFQVWEQLFASTYYDETIDGYTRYRALVRLTILYYTHREFDKLKGVYQHLDEQFKTPVFYSRRILANYYANKAMMHSKLGELDEAERFGRLSLMYRNNDYLFYLINLMDVLLKAGKNREALQIMNEAVEEFRQSGNHYYRIGYAAYYIRTLLANGQKNRAVEYAETFLQGYKDEIMEFRWHLFFSAFLDALFRCEKYGRITTLVSRFKLVAREKQLQGTNQYLPVIQLFHTASEYMQGSLSAEAAYRNINQLITGLGQNRFRSKKTLELLQTLEKAIPDLIARLKSEVPASLSGDYGTIIDTTLSNY